MIGVARWTAGLAALALGSGYLAAPAPSGPGVAPPVAQVAQTARKAPPPQARAPLAFQFAGAMVQGGAVLGTAPLGTTVLTLDNEPVKIDSDGRFLIAFDRDAGPTATLTARLENGATVNHPLRIAPRAWRIERLATLPRFSQPSEEFRRRRPDELAQINAARRLETGASGWRQPFMWPVTGRVSGLFGAQRIYRGEPGAYHSGVDVARPTGTPVIAPADGVVILAAASPFTIEGNLLMIDHGMGLNSAFLHLSRIDVRLGQSVRRGERIGAIGTTGRSTGPHLHWGMKWRDRRIDPLLIAGPMPAAD